MAAFAVSVMIAAIVSPFASTAPDGLERVAEDLGFSAKASDPSVNAPLADYSTPGVESESVSTGVAGISGVIIVFAAGAGLGLILSWLRGSNGRR
ncbi:MAG: PDGLE domain-containing protein [Nitrospinae bacterium]|nr:PDGLE domain-containing protein [Nitrospinota bacterium]